jgi:hypothetical protein
VEYGNEFSGVIKNDLIKEGIKIRASATVDKTDLQTGGLKIAVGGYITVKVVVADGESLSALSGGKNLVVDKKDISVVKSLGIKTAIYPIEEEFSLSYPVEEVISHRADAIVTAVQCGMGSIIVDGEAVISLILLQKNQKRDIIKENKTLPFRMEIECDDATPSMQAVALVKEKSFKTDVSVDEEKGESSVAVSVNLKFEGEAFLDESVSVALDAFSVDEVVELESEELPCYKACEQRCLSSAFGGKVGVEELPIGAVLYAVGGESVEVTKKGCSGGALKVVGVLSAVGYFSNEGKFFTRKIEMPFECKLDCEFSCDTDLEILVKNARAKGKIVALNQLDIECELTFNIYPTECFKVKYIKGVKSVGEKKKKAAALSVYIPMEGEELWKLAKRLGVTPETLVETNKDLCFPLTGKERIVIYRQK